jgi:hypothetical protein
MYESGERNDSCELMWWRLRRSKSGIHPLKRPNFIHEIGQLSHKAHTLARATTEMSVGHHSLLSIKISRWCMQNSCMNFVICWCIFQYIKMLWDVTIIFCIDLWGFSLNPPYFGYKLKLTETFSGVPIFIWEATWDEEAREGAIWVQTRPGGAGLGQVWPPRPIWPSDLWCHPSSLQIAQPNLKSPI